MWSKFYLFNYKNVYIFIEMLWLKNYIIHKAVNIKKSHVYTG